MHLRRLTWKIVWTLLFLVVATAVWAGVYVYKQGFTKRWRTLVAEEFKKQGIDVTFQRLTLDPFRGIVAKSVKILDAKDGQTFIAKIDQIVLDLNYGNLLHGEPFLNAVDLRDATLALPIDPADPKSKRFRINRLNARLLLPAHQAYLSKAEADVYGIRVSARGRLINLEAFQPSKPMSNEKAVGRTETVLRIISELKELEFRAGAPLLDIRFSGDLANPNSLFVEATLSARKLTRHGYSIESLWATGSYRDRVLTLAGLDLRDPAGLLQVTGGYDDRTKEVGVQLRSTLDLVRLLEALDVSLPVADLTFHSPPNLELNGSGTLNDSHDLLVTGHLDARQFEVQGIAFESAVGDFSWDGTRWSIRGFQLDHSTGTAKVDAIQLEDSFKANLESSLDPTILLPFVKGKTASFLSEWKFKRPPRIQLSARGTTFDFDKLTIKGEMELGPTSFRGQALESGSTKIQVEDRVATYEDFRVVRREGIGTGTFIYDFGRKEVRLKDLRLSLNPAEVAVWISSELVEHISPYRFRKPPSLTVNGVVHYQKGDTTDLDVEVLAPDGMDYTFLGKQLTFPSIRGNLKIVPGRLKLSNLRGTLFGGKVLGKADISIRREEPGYSAELELTGVNFDDLTDLYFDYDSSKGRLNGWFEWAAKTKDPRTIVGSGELEIKDGDVFAIPTLGPLSAILNNIVPGMGYSHARQAVASFTVRDGVISTKDFAVSAEAFELRGEGDLHYLDNEIDFNVRIQARGVPGVLLFPVSKLFEYTAGGTLRDPEWRPKNLPHPGAGSSNH